MHKLPGQTRRFSAPSPPPTRLKRSGAIRRPTNPLFSTQATDEDPIMRKRSHTTPTARRDRKKTLIQEDSTSTPTRLPNPKQAMDHLHNNEDPDDDDDTDSEASQHWHDALEWNLDRVGQLRDILKIWVEGAVPADEIGDFLVSCLYRCDDHLEYRLTRMVDDRDTYAHIARVLIEYFQIRDDEANPLWTQIRPGDPQRRPGHIHDDDADERQMGECRADDYHMDARTEKKTTIVSHLVAPQPVRPIRWPLFLVEDFHEPDYLIQQAANGNKIEGEGEISMRYSQQNGLAIFGNAERKALVHRPESDFDDFECQTAEMIIPPPPGFT